MSHPHQQASFSVEIELVAIDEWPKVPQNTCSNLVINYNKLLNELVKGKGFAIDY